MRKYCCHSSCQIPVVDLSTNHSRSASLGFLLQSCPQNLAIPSNFAAFCVLATESVNLRWLVWLSFLNLFTGRTYRNRWIGSWRCSTTLEVDLSNEITHYHNLSNKETRTDSKERFTHWSSNVWKLCGVDLAHIPGHYFGDGVKRVLSLRRGQSDIQNGLGKRNFQHNIFNLWKDNTNARVVDNINNSSSKQQLWV